MHITALAWIYVVSMMAITEPSVIAGLMTFTFYCVIPLGLAWSITIFIKRKIIKPHIKKDTKDSELKIQ